MLELLEAYGFFGLQQGSVVLLGLVRAKILASLLGPYGVGVFSQANAFFVLLQGFFALGLSGSLTKLVAEYRAQEDFKRLNQTIVSVMTLYALVGGLLIAIAWLASAPLARFAFNDLTYRHYIVIVSLTAFTWVQLWELLLIFRGLLHWRESSLVAVIGNAFNILLVAICVIVWELNGAVISLFLSQVVNLTIAFFFLIRRVGPQHQIQFWQYRPSREIISRLFNFAAPITLLNLVASSGYLLIRSQIVHQLGAESNGLYQGIMSVSQAYMGFLSTSVWSYGIPKISSLVHNREEAVNIQNNGMRVSLLALAPFTLMLLAGREIWIPILYSSAFISIAPLFIWQAMGDILLVVRQNILISLVPFEKIRNYFIEGVFYWLGYVSLSMFGIPRWGIAAPLVAFFSINVVMLCVDVFYQSKVSGFRLRGDNWILLAKGIPLLTAGYITAQWTTNLPIRLVVCGIIAVIMLLWLPSRDELQKAFAYANAAAEKFRFRYKK